MVGNEAGEMPGRTSLMGSARSLNFIPSWAAIRRF